MLRGDIFTWLQGPAQQHSGQETRVGDDTHGAVYQTFLFSCPDGDGEKEVRSLSTVCR